MAISDYQPETREIKFKGGSFRVKGLTFDAITKLIQKHLGSIDQMFDTVNNKFGDSRNITQTVLSDLAMTLLVKAPDLMVEVIAIAADEHTDSGVEAIRKLPFPIQLVAVVEIGRLTFEEVGGVGKFVETMGPLFAGMMSIDKQQAIVRELRQGMEARQSGSTRAFAAM